MIPHPLKRFRRYASIFAIILGIESAWLLGAEMTRATLPFFPTNEAEAKTSTSQANAAATAAWLGWPRGELWTDYAMTIDIGLLSNIENATSSRAAAASNELHSIAEHAAALAPYDSRAWLLVAATNITSEQRSNEALAQIKMSYYTSPNDIRLTPLRIQIATRSSVIADGELQTFVENELRTIILHNPDMKPSIALAYRNASSAGRRFFESRLADLDAEFLRQLQGAKP